MQAELELLTRVNVDSIGKAPEMASLEEELRSVNEQLWDIEDQIRAKERDGDFDAEFIRLARSVYKTNDRRSNIKSKINVLAGSQIKEEKSYQEY